MSDEITEERDAMWLDNTGLIRWAVLVAAILIALLYSRSCFTANSGAGAGLAAGTTNGLVMDRIGVSSAGDLVEFSGTGNPGEWVNIVVNGSDIVGSVPVNADGSWRLQLQDLFSPGDYEAIAQYRDVDGQTGTRLFLVSAPAVEVAAAPTANVNITGLSTSRNSDGPVTITGTATPGSTVSLSFDDFEVYKTVVGPDGTWSFTGYVPAGTHNVLARAFANDAGDSSGQAADASGPFEIEVAAAREIQAVNNSRNGLLRILFDGIGQIGEGTAVGGNAAAAGSGANDGAPAVELIVDASWSMTLPLDSNEEADRLTVDDPESRIAIAQNAMVDLVENVLPEGTEVAVRAFGNLEGNLACRTDLMSELQPLDREAVAAIVGGIEPQFDANTHIAGALEEVRNDLAGTDREKIVVLLTDGQETCGGDPAAVIEGLVADGLNVSLNVIGFAILDDELKAQFAEWAELGNGEFYDATDAELLGNALERTMTVGYTVQDADGNFVRRGVVGGQFLELEPGVYTVLNRQGDVVYQNIVITPGGLSALAGG